MALSPPHVPSASLFIQRRRPNRQDRKGSCPVVGKLTNFDLWPLPWGEGHGVQGQICDILRPQLAMNRFLPLWPHRFPHFGCINLGGWGALILDRCRAFDLFASVDAHLWHSILDCSCLGDDYWLFCAQELRDLWRSLLSCTAAVWVMISDCFVPRN
jgi:hypothetical protein